MILAWVGMIINSSSTSHSKTRQVLKPMFIMQQLLQQQLSQYHL
jgi:hypothetical protein